MKKAFLIPHRAYVARYPILDEFFRMLPAGHQHRNAGNIGIEYRAGEPFIVVGRQDQQVVPVEGGIDVLGF